MNRTGRDCTDFAPVTEPAGRYLHRPGRRCPCLPRQEHWAKQGVDRFELGGQSSSRKRPGSAGVPAGSDRTTATAGFAWSGRWSSPRPGRRGRQRSQDSIPISLRCRKPEKAWERRRPRRLRQDHRDGWVCLERTVVQSTSWPARTPALAGLNPDLATMPEAGCGLILAYDLPYKPVNALAEPVW